MMSNINGILNIAKGALSTHQRAIDVTGHNIANVNTPGYSRQRATLVANEPASSSYGQMGTGVKVQEIKRIYDRFLGNQINAESSSLGRWEAQKGGLEKAEMILTESSGYGLSQAMSAFWNAWQDLVNNPSGHTERLVLSAKGQTLANTFNSVHVDLKRVQADMDVNIVGTVREINRVTDEIADLNRQIAQIEGSGQNANDLRDKRDLLLNELSYMVDVTSSEGGDGSIAVSLSSGRPLVQNDRSWGLSTESNSSGLQNILWQDGSGDSVDITHTLSGGELKGWIEVRDLLIPGYLTSLDELAKEIMEGVNSLHMTGFGLDGSTGTEFFTGWSASDMAVNPNIVSDVNTIAAAGSASGAPGDNSMAIAIANLQHEWTMAGHTTTFDNFYDSMISRLGTHVQEAMTHFDHEAEMVNRLNTYRESVSGVSLDEEMLNLIKFQHAYEAAARLITTADELMETIIAMV
ncbi:MAG: flagellar hook-associated protein FlgK [Thermodesulfobacteriota bacterium]|nr:flagellar hook-associated protein FlgK [Thermodesulfobacteriota bacterium]